MLSLHQKTSLCIRLLDFLSVCPLDVPSLFVYPLDHAFTSLRMYVVSVYVTPYINRSVCIHRINVASVYTFVCVALYVCPMCMSPLCLLPTYVYVHCV